LTKRKALVTGGLGFIGSHLVDDLLSSEWDVVVLDNLLTGFKQNLSHQNENEHLKLVLGDIRDAGLLKDLTVDCDAVFHLAAHALMRVSLKDRKADLDFNLVGTINVLEAMLENKVPDFVFASTSALYGEAKIMPTPESYFGTQTSLYGAAKLACEAFAEAYTQLAEMKVWAFRFGTVLGERCRRGAIWDFVAKVHDNPEELEILGDGKQKKDYLYVGDCVDGIMTGYEKEKRGACNIFNIGLQELTSIDKLADMVIQAAGLVTVTKKKYTGGPRGWIGDNPIVHLDVSKLKSLGWKPKVTSQETIERTIGWTLANRFATVN
jgi:UDP-glucose 4-epimerase